VTLLAVFGVFVLALLLCLITFVQLLFMEAVRIRAREVPSLGFFKEHLEDRISHGSPRAVLAFSLTKHTFLVLQTLLWISIMENKGESPWMVFLQAGAAAWLVLLATCYMIPQIMLRKTSGQWLLPLLPILRVLVIAARPLTAILGFFESLVELAEPETTGADSPTPAEHIDALISAGEEEGIIAGDDRKLIESVVAFGDKTVREVMTPRPNIVAIAVSRSLDDLRQLVIHEQYSRIPVYDNDIDGIIGFIHVRDMFELDEEERSHKTIRDLLRPIRQVPESKPVNDLLREMQQHGAHMAIVIDEYGNTAGLVTMEDMVEEIVGEIRDEHEPDHDVTAGPDGTYVMAGSLDLSRLNELLGFRAQEETESTTVGGLAAEWLGHVPKVGEAVEREGIRIEVLAGNELRVEQVKVSRAENGAHA
jgi:CBS domain containing-hemolysin-like protein